MVYLPTWMVDFYAKCRQIYQSHGSYGMDQKQKKSNRLLGESTSGLWLGEKIHLFGWMFKPSEVSDLRFFV